MKKIIKKIIDFFNDNIIIFIVCVILQTCLGFDLGGAKVRSFILFLLLLLFSYICEKLFKFFIQRKRIKKYLRENNVRYDQNFWQNLNVQDFDITEIKEVDKHE